MKSPLALVLAIIALLAAAYGIMRIDPPPREKALLTSPEIGADDGSPNKEGSNAASVPLSRGRLPVEKSGQAAVAVELADVPVESEAWSEERRRDVGEPLDADEEDLWSTIPEEEDPIEIGPELDADDPMAWKLSEEPGEPVDIGPVLNAGEPRDY